MCFYLSAPATNDVIFQPIRIEQFLDLCQQELENVFLINTIPSPLIK